MVPNFIFLCQSLDGPTRNHCMSHSTSVGINLLKCIGQGIEFKLKVEIFNFLIFAPI